jgi:hypothetical protein
MFISPPGVLVKFQMKQIGNVIRYSLDSVAA